MLINAVKDIASSLDVLISAARMVADDKADKAKLGSLHEAAKVYICWLGLYICWLGLYIC